MTQPPADAIRGVLAAVERAVGPGTRAAYASRAAALEHLEVHVLDRLGFLAEDGPLPPDLAALEVAATALHRGIEGANARTVRRLRRRIANGLATPAAIRRALMRHGAVPDGRTDYDALDLLATDLLDGGEAVETRLARDPEMVAYQPTPAHAILDLVDRAAIGPGDHFYDLGAGLGHVVLLVALLARARGTGIELEPTYCAQAARAAGRLNVRDVAFVAEDVRTASLEGGTVYFLYTPFKGAMMQAVLARLAAEARQRPIRVATYGPCTPYVAEAAWLAPRGPVDTFQVAVFDSR